MPTNEFDLSVRPEYVSNRLAIPFNELNAMASQHQKEYDNAEDSAYKFKDLMASVKAIHDPSLGLSNIGAKDALYSKYAPRIEAISNEIAKGNNISEANRKLTQLQREWVNDPTRVELENSYGNYTKYVEDKTKKGGKYDQLLDDYRGQQLVGEKGELKPFRFNGMEDALDIEKRFSESMDKIKEDMKGWDIESLGTDGIKIGKKGTQAGITADKVMGVARTKVQGMLTQTLEGQQFVKKLRRLNPNLTNEELVNEGVKALFASGSEQIGMEKTSGNSVDVTPMWAKKYDEGKAKEEAERAMIGQPIEGATINLTKDDKDFNELKELGIYKENNDGTLSLDINQVKNKAIYDKVNYDKGSYSFKVGETPDKYFLNKVGKHLGKIAQSIGYDKPITPANFNDILSKYNIYSKVRMSDEQMPAPVSKIESEKAMRNWNNYDVMNIDSPDKPLEEKPVLEKGDKLVLNNWRNTPNGKMNRDGFIRKEDGTIVPIMVRPKAIIDDKYHNTISELGLLSAQYEAGKVKPIRTEGTGKGKLEVINDRNIPGVGKLETFGFIDSKTDKKTTGYLMTPEDGSEPLSFSTQADMQQYLNYKYYGTETGNTDRYNVAPNKATFEDTEQEQQ